MCVRLVSLTMMVLLGSTTAWAQSNGSSSDSVKWRPPGAKKSAKSSGPSNAGTTSSSAARSSVLVNAAKPKSAVRHASAEDPIAPRTAGERSVRTASIPGTTPRTPIARVTKGNGTLPNDRGQVWREYDISPYTLRVTATNQPEQAIVDWILRETGYEAWHGEEVALLSASSRTLRVYHTPEKQAIVGEIVDRFVNTEAETQAMTVRVATVGHPNWRARAARMLRPVPTQTQGIQAWLLAKEDAALLVAELARRSDFRQHSSPHLLVNNGQTTIINGTRSRQYVRGVLANPTGVPGFAPDVAQLTEGYSLELSPLVALDGSTIDAVLKFQNDQVEKMLPVQLQAPGPVQQWVNTEVPQMSGNRLQERFRWPADKVLLVSMGMVASPTPQLKSPLALPLTGNTAPRADTLIFIENKGKVVRNVQAAGTASAPAKKYHDRY